jgi:hypothetical protein
MKRLITFLGYTAAGLTIAFAALTPFVFLGYFSRVVAGAGFHTDPVYSGGDPERVIDKGSYQIVVHRPVPDRTLLAIREPFVQLTWKPAAAVPARVSEELDVDGDSRPDLRAVFDVPQDPAADLQVDVTPLAPLVQPMNRIGKESFSRLIARVGDSIVVRVPLARSPR